MLSWKWNVALQSRARTVQHRGIKITLMYRVGSKSASGTSRCSAPQRHRVTVAIPPVRAIRNADERKQLKTRTESSTPRIYGSMGPQLENRIEPPAKS